MVLGGVQGRWMVMLDGREYEASVWAIRKILGGPVGRWVVTLDSFWPLCLEFGWF